MMYVSPTSPKNIWTTDEFQEMLEHFVQQEVTARIDCGREPLTAFEYNRLIDLIVQNVNGCVVPAGRA